MVFVAGRQTSRALVLSGDAALLCINRHYGKSHMLLQQRINSRSIESAISPAG